MPSRIALATLALGTALTAVPALAQNYGGSDNSAQQYKYPIGRPVDDGGIGYGTQNTAAPQHTVTQHTGSAANRLARRTGAYQPHVSPYRQAQYGAPQGQYGEPQGQYGEPQGQYGERGFGVSYYNYAGGPGYGPGPGADQGAIDWCAARFRSFDPATGTYLGFDGIRHSCP